MTLPDDMAPSCCRPRQLQDGTTLWRLWAPKVRQVELVLVNGPERRILPMSQRGDGFFEHALPDVREGQRYAYRLNAGPERPDPCSLWQPDGVHQPSAVFYPERFAWTDQSWRGVPRQDLVFYELHVGTFTERGTFDGVIDRLPELKELGVTALEIMPVAQFAGERNWGYDGVHLFAAQNSYGGPREFMRLVDAAHAHGLAVFLDVVYNHFGPEGNYIGEFGHYYSQRYRTPWGPAFNFDGRDSDPVRQFVIDNVWYWIHEFHLDGLRLDAVHAMFDISPVHILRELKIAADRAAAARGATATIVLESLLNDVRMLLPSERGGYGADAEWNEDFHHALLAFLTGERHGKYVDYGPASRIPQVLEHTYFLSGTYSQFRGRKWGRPVGDLPGDRFVIGIQNHDHVGNRAWGERLAHLMPPAVQRLAASLMLLAPYLPLLFMGEEYGEENPFLFFCAFQDPQLIQNVRAGRRRDYALAGDIPDPQDAASFNASRLSWSWPKGTHRAGLRRLYQHLIAARRQWPALRNWSDRAARLVPDATRGPVLGLIRGETAPGGETLSIFFNLSAETQPLPAKVPAGQALLWSSEAAIYGGLGAAMAGQLRAYECLIFGPPGWQIEVLG